MKICHKKNFWAGAGMLALGLLNLVTALWRRDLDASAVVLVVALVLLGGGSLLRGLSPKLPREDKIEEQVERNVLVRFKTSASAFRWTRLVSFGLLLSLLLAGAATGEELLLAVAVGLAFSLTISFFAEFFSALYHESNN
ncbi:MAG TPA: hypothetical protein H9838_01230 [Candidatus Acutalibacter pullistercoris]|uniref:DUF2178 domain-containing protein n=1 Tax=Candidatus Acutalibacter pullistercoris TaxID=2838418 RepID=A0A9D2C0I6_9FIRM|nr:hypothetical protein [Candidatus Acutalibacter pullistercoris]